jgi:5-hydroxyisourate hydrolase-like protein (transthyretin family)
MRHKLTALFATSIAFLTAVVLAATLQNIVGTVTFSVNGGPSRGTQVRFVDAMNAELLSSVITDDFGRYDSGAIPIGSYRVQFLGPGVPNQYAGAGGVNDFCSGTIVPVSASTTTTLDVQVVSCGLELPSCGPVKALPGGEIPGILRLSGRVVDAATGVPLQGIRVSLLESFSAEPVVILTTDAAGWYAYDSQEPAVWVFRIRFTDPGGTYAPQFYGTDADAFCGAATVNPAIQLMADGFLKRVPPEQLTQQLADTVQSYNLPPNVSTLLGTPLTQARKLLSDDRDGNNGAACAQLASFLTRVDVLERRGELSAVEANELRRLGANLRTELGCQ